MMFNVPVPPCKLAAALAFGGLTAFNTKIRLLREAARAADIKRLASLMLST